jgi:hypothetical protein
MAQREDLELEGGARSEAGAERREEGEEDRLHEDSKLPHLSGTKREPPAPAHAPRNSRDVGQFGVFGTHRLFHYAALPNMKNERAVTLMAKFDEMLRQNRVFCEVFGLI